MNYEDRIVLFFDILGFRNLINSSIDGSMDKSSEIKKKLDYISKFYKEQVNDKYFKSTRISFFSDSVIISFKESEPDQLFSVIADLQILLMNLAFRGVFMRGAITFGKLYHDKTLIFGPAFISAYDRERKEAIYPRIICDEKILLLNQGKKSLSEYSQDLPCFFRILNVDEDKNLYVDYFEKAITTTDSVLEAFTYFLALKELISKHLDDSRLYKQTKVARKYLWMRNKYNTAIKELKTMYSFKQLGDDELKLLYKQLTRIK